VTRVIRGGHQAVGGIATLGQDVFVSRYKSQQVQVYSAVTLALQRHLTVPDLGPYSYDMDTCAAVNCLLLTDYYNDSVHRVQLSGNNAVTKWSVARRPVGLSVSNINHVLVVSEGDRKLQIFTTSGNLLQNIQLASDITSPNHAVQLSNDALVLCDAGHRHRVCLITTDGRILSSCTGTCTRLSTCTQPDIKDYYMQ